VGFINWITDRTTRHTTTAGRHTVKSAMTPIIWPTVIISPSCFASAVCLKESTVPCVTLIAIGAIPILTMCGIYIYFAMKDPDRLQDEDYRLRGRMLDITESKGGKIRVSDVSLSEIANPYPSPKALPRGGDKGEDAAKEDDMAGEGVSDG
jgi:hypothetical protein